MRASEWMVLQDHPSLACLVSSVAPTYHGPEST